MKTIFITGTDTGVGKTYFSVALIRQLNGRGYKTFGMKPIASGSNPDASGKLLNEDAVNLQNVSSIKRPYDVVNPIVFAPPIAPNIGAKYANVDLSVKLFSDIINNSLPTDADFNIIEGTGGWSVPINDSELLSDLACSLNIPIILVVGIKLGCINHAILTCNNIIQMQAPFIGWVANCVELGTQPIDDIIDTLKHWIPVPCLGVIQYNLESASEINLELLLE